MEKSIRDILIGKRIEASAPCRIDMGGTLDLSTFYMSLKRYAPCTFNIALAMRTFVTIQPCRTGITRIKSKGFQPAEFSLAEAPFDHPLGLMFAIANYFEADGVEISIDSTSPPRSALGGSSSAAVALTAAFEKALLEGKPESQRREDAVLLAHALEGSVAGVPCGLQDHLAAAYGGINAWYWPSFGAHAFRQERVIEPDMLNDVEKHLLVAYCGIPHVSQDINRRWVEQFVSGQNREKWIEICALARQFVDAMKGFNYRKAAFCMNREVEIRKEMTPQVLDDIGEALTASAVENGCGARFTGAGAGGSLWALGDIEDVDRLGGIWENILQKREDACLLSPQIDGRGVTATIMKRDL